MNRRAFFLSGGSAAALVATGGLGTSRKAFAQAGGGLDPSFLQWQTNIVATAFGNIYNNRGTDADPYIITSVCTQMAGYLRDSGADAAMMQSVARINPTAITSTAVDPSILYNALRPATANLQMQDLADLVNHYALNPRDIPNVLAGLQQNGIAHYLDLMADNFREMGDGFNLAPAGASIYGGPIDDLTLNPQPTPPDPGNYGGDGGGGHHLTPFQPLPPDGAGDPPDEAAKKRFDCAKDTDHLFEFGVGCALLGSYCWVGVVTGPFCTLGLAALLGVIAVAWSLIHIKKCGK